VVGFVVGVAVAVGFLTGLALTYARQRLTDEPSGETDRAR
jgi:RsiW-degrading membrane proteinase PrsW (M82 family)